LIQRLLDTGRDEEASLLDHSWHLEMFEFRERHLLETLARRLRGAADADDPFAVFNAAQDHLLAAARAHVDMVLLQAFADAIDAHTGLAPTLDPVFELFALSTIEAERGWFQEHGRLTAARSKGVIAEVNRLCGQLRPSALDLMAAFGIPEETIAAAI
jgi:acyl-CoA oxidase